MTSSLKKNQQKEQREIDGGRVERMKKSTALKPKQLEKYVFTMTLIIDMVLTIVTFKLLPIGKIMNLY